MATTLSSTRTGASRASVAVLNSIAPKQASKSASASSSKITWRQGQGPRVPAKLVEDIHRKLYPQLYDASGKPTVQLQRTAVVSQKAREKRGELSGWAPLKTDKPSLKLRKPLPPIKKTCPDPVSSVTAAQIARLDPTGARTRLFAKDNPEGARVGDILLVRLRTGDPFAGVCINIRRQGADTSILLRGQLTRVGVEMWYKVYSPLVEGIEVVQRRTKRARRARLTYMRTVKHDRGSVENVVRVYLRQKAALGTAEGQKKKGAAAAAAAAGGKKGNKRGKKR